MVSIEKNIPLSQSKLWQAQRDFFDHKGIQAWHDQVPFFVSSNPYIAEVYANLITAYLKDLLSQKVIDFTAHVYIFEFGAGSGQFSFYCLKQLQKLLQLSEFKQLTLCYVMTDFTDNNIQFWEQQSVLKPFLTNSNLRLDFAKFDFENLTPIHLRQQNKSLHSLQNPCILIGNYIFDSVRQDYYGMDHGILMEHHIETLLPSENYDLKTGHIHSLKEARIVECPIAYNWATGVSSDQAYLHFYETHLNSGLFSLPIGGFKALDFIKTLAPQGYLLISSDKGYNALNEIESRQKLDLSIHGSLSLEVNFHALSLYFEFLGGRSQLQSYKEGIKTNLFLTHNQATPCLDEAFEKYCENFSPADYFQYHRNFRDANEIDLGFALTQLHLSRFDPYVFSLMTDKLCNAAKKEASAKPLLDAFAKIIPLLAENIYPVSQHMDHYFNFGLFLHSAQRYDEAIFYYKASLSHQGEQFANLYNLGLCHYILKDYAAAKIYFAKAASLKPVED